MTRLLYRPIGLAELESLRASGWREWPPLPEHQPVFFPVLSFEYAEKIARGWTSRQPPEDLGFVTRFRIPEALAACYPERLAESHDHVELWVPAEDMAAFNEALDAPIELLAGYRNGERMADEELDGFRGKP